LFELANFFFKKQLQQVFLVPTYRSKYTRCPFEFQDTGYRGKKRAQLVLRSFFAEEEVYELSVHFES